MRRIILSVFFLFVFFALFNQKASAFTCSISPNPLFNNGSASSTTLTFTSTDGSIASGNAYHAVIQANAGMGATGPCTMSTGCPSNDVTASANNTLTITWGNTSLTVIPNGYTVRLIDNLNPANSCSSTITVTSSPTPTPTPPGYTPTPTPPQTIDCTNTSICCACQGAQPAMLQNIGGLTGTDDWECIPTSGSNANFRYSPATLPSCSSAQYCDATGKGCVNIPTPSPCPNCTGVSAVIPSLAGIALGMVPSGGASTLNNVLRLIVSLLILFAIILSLLYLIWGGINWLTSEGDKTRLEAARQKIIYAILGLILVFVSYLVLNLIYYFFFRHNLTGVG